MPRNIVYHPPSRKLVSEYATQVCKRLAEQYGEAYAAPDVISGFTEFMLIFATMLAKRLNTDCEMEDKVAKKSD